MLVESEHFRVVRVKPYRYCSLMDQNLSKIDRVTGAVIENMRLLRRQRDWSAEDLAREMAGVGVPWTRLVVAKLENQRRQSLSIAEVLALSVVFEVGLVHLIVPLDDDSGQFEITPGREVPVTEVRDFIRGLAAMDGMDMRKLWSWLPGSEFVEVTHGLTPEGAPVVKYSIERGSGRRGYQERFGRRKGTDGES